MSSTASGRAAEQLVAETLLRRGYKVLEQNWRTRWCEIDIVASKKRAVYFVEVKYRKSQVWGDGLDAITPRKLAQMKFAAELWVSSHDWTGDVDLMVASVSGLPPRIDQIIEV